MLALFPLPLLIPGFFQLLFKLWLLLLLGPERLEPLFVDEPERFRLLLVLATALTLEPLLVLGTTFRLGTLLGPVLVLVLKPLLGPAPKLVLGLQRLSSC